MSKRRLKPGRFFLGMLVLAVILIGMEQWMNRGTIPVQQIIDKYLHHSVVAVGSRSQGVDEIYSAHAILVKTANHEVMLSKASDERTYPASLTKIMTTILAIEHLPELKQTILLRNEIFKGLIEDNASIAGFLPNEKVKAIDLLYGAMLPSGAEAAVGLAVRVSGSEKKFAALMNEKANKLGMKDSYFTNATGLHDPNHYTTVKDMAVLLQYALKNETFKKIFTTERYAIAPTNMHTSGMTVVSTLFRETGGIHFEGGEIIGGKTGFTDEAGLCLASLAVKDGDEYLLITAGAAGNHATEQYNITDARYIYSNYTRHVQ